MCLFLISSAGFAQSDRSTITGTISDPGGAVIASAPILARNLSTGVSYSAASTGTGNYSISELPVGNYELTISVPGFKKAVRQGLEIQAAQTVRVDFTLEVGGATESVTVTEAAPLLKTESGELSHSVTGETLDALPVLGIGANASNSGIRNPYSATQLLPGGIFTGDVTVHVNGTPNNTSVLRVEGQDSTNQTITAFGSQNQPSVEAIQEFAVQTSNYAAEFGQAGGAVFIATMKSGTNQLHGSGYDYFVNEYLNASTPYLNTTPRARRNDYGFTFGGPVVFPKLYNGKNRTFFFYNFEQYRETQIVNNVPDTVPTAAYRAGNFTTALTGRTLNLANSPVGTIAEGEIFDPLTQSVNSAGQVIRSAFPQNMIPLSRIDPVAAAIQNLIPAPNQPGLINNYLPAYNSIRHTDNNSIKVDQIITQKSKLSVFYDRTHTFSPYSSTLQGDGLPQEISMGITNNDWVHTTRVNFDYTVTPTLLWHVGVGYVNQHGPDAQSGGTPFNPASIGLKGVANNDGKFPVFWGPTIGSTSICQAGPTVTNQPQACAGQGGMTRFGPGTPAGDPKNSIYSFRPTGNTSLTWIRGNHTYKLGGETNIMNFMYATHPGNGTFSISPNETSLPWLSTQNVQGEAIGFAYASFLLGAVDSGTIGSPTDQHQSKKSFATFIQDSWKISRKLTLDYGLRWDFLTYLKEEYGRQPSFSQTVLNPNAGNRPGGLIYEGDLTGRCQCNFASNYPFAIGPRVGLAYQVTPKTVIRAGFGVVYANTSTYDNYTITSSTPFVSPGQYVPSMYLAQGIPVVPNPWPDFAAGQYPNIPGQLGTLPSGVGIVDPHAGRPPRQLQWSIGIQREVIRNLLLEASYVGNRGAYWAANGLVSYNATMPSTLAALGLNINSATDRALLLDPVNNPAVIARGFTAPYAGFPATATLAQALRPFPQFTSNITGQYAPLGDTWYNSLQFKATKRLSHGLDAGYSLAWQKSLTNGAESEGTGGGQVNDVFNRSNSKYLSLYDQPLVSIISVNYTTQKWGTNKLLSMLARDWTAGAYLSYRSGLPILAPVSTNNTSALLFQSTFDNRVAGQPLFTQNLNCHCVNPLANFVLNPAAWTNPTDGQFGTAAAYYDDYRYQRRPTENANLGRTFRFKERMTFAVRAEFTNIFNRLEMANPTTTPATLAQTRTASGAVAAGYGAISTINGTLASRQGTIVGRFTF